MKLFGNSQQKTKKKKEIIANNLILLSCIFSYLIKNVDSFEHENWISKADTYVSQFEPNRSDFLVESFPR